jgi:hypothetical protein
LQLLRLDQQIKKKTDDTENQRPEKGVPEIRYLESLYQYRRKIKHESIYQKGEKAQCQEVYRQGQKQYQRSQEGVEKAEDQSGGYGGDPAAHRYPGDDIDDREKADSIDEPLQQKNSHWILPFAVLLTDGITEHKYTPNFHRFILER